MCSVRGLVALSLPAQIIAFYTNAVRVLFVLNDWFLSQKPKFSCSISLEYDSNLWVNLWLSLTVLNWDSSVTVLYRFTPPRRYPNSLRSHLPLFNNLDILREVDIMYLPLCNYFRLCIASFPRQNYLLSRLFSKTIFIISLATATVRNLACSTPLIMRNLNKGTIETFFKLVKVSTVEISRLWFLSSDIV